MRREPCADRSSRSADPGRSWKLGVRSQELEARRENAEWERYVSALPLAFFSLHLSILHSVFCGPSWLSCFRFFASSRSAFLFGFDASIASGEARVGWRWWACARCRSLVPPHAIPPSPVRLRHPAAHAAGSKCAFLIHLLACSLALLFLHPPRGPPIVEELACRYPT